MTDQTKIEWTDFTVNFWEGCQKVGSGCDNCYAEARDIRFTGGSHWGPGAPRRKVAGGIPKLRKINRDAEVFRQENGHWPRVFCSSLSDVFDNAVDVEWRCEAQSEMELATNCRIILLSKRIGNVERMVLDHWTDGDWPSHIGLMITVVNQAEADRDIPKLLDLKARLGIPWVGLSVEPMLGSIDLERWLYERLDVRAAGLEDDPMAAGMLAQAIADGHGAGPMLPCVDWVICGGESGPKARPMHSDWARSLREQCKTAGTAFLFKQWGAWCSMDDLPDVVPHKLRADLSVGVIRFGKKRAGRLLDGRTWDQFPEALA